jgi:micrococcal nuclease
MIAALLLCAAAHVVDGDTIRCSGVGRVRLVAIDTADKTSSAPCRLHYGDHVCDDAKAAAGSASLHLAVDGHRVTYRIVSYDTRNHRPVAQMFAGRRDLQCFQLRAHVARYLARYDTGKTIARRCPSTVRKADR